MNYIDRVHRNSIMLAPMEGVTDGPYRQLVRDAFGGWDTYFCDFLRIPTDATFKAQTVKDHMGKEYWESLKIKQSTGFQILVSTRSRIKENIEVISSTGVDWIDLNLGCPSKKVNGHKGGAYLLDDLTEMERIVREIRDNFNGLFTCKIRLGYKDTSNFERILKTLEECGAQAITIHGRTKEQLYKGIADWTYIKKAVDISNLPIIGNGDVWTPLDIKNIFDQTGCYGVMIARGAMKTPWLASQYKKYISQLAEVTRDKEFLEFERVNGIKKYFRSLENGYAFKKENLRLKRYKGLSRYLFDDFINAEILKSKALRSQGLNEFLDTIESL